MSSEAVVPPPGVELSRRGFVLLLAAAIDRVASAAQSRGVLTVQVSNARSAKGRIGVALFAGPAGFPEGVKLALKTADAAVDPATRGARIVFEDLPYGTYAVAVRHDENDNGKLDKNFVGMPKEGYAFSNNPRRRMGAPPFDEARFTLGEPAQTVEIALTY